MSTKYEVIANDVVVATKAKKQDAIDAASAIRDDERVDVRVATTKGTVVFEQAAPKSINMSKPYTRVVSVTDEVVEMIDGKRVAYKRPRVGFALLDANLDASDAGNGTYSIWDLVRGEQVDIEVATTREAGRWFADDARAYRDALPVLEA